jgi:pyruvate/2-oxoglutarate dehydrogenase complex dihydrolipoamide dehydrogenase (E3) component
MLEQYQNVLREVAEDAFLKYLNGESALYQIGRIPNIEELDYKKVMYELDKIWRELVVDFESQYGFYEEFNDEPDIK